MASNKPSDETGSARANTPERPTNIANSTAFIWIWVAYAAALTAAAATLLQPWVPLGDSVLLRALAADVVATLVIFGFSTAFANASFYDAYWSVAPPFLAGYFLLAQDGSLDLRAILMITLVCAWALRLTHNWARGWQGLGHEDWRYVDLQRTTGRSWWLVNLLGIHLFPTALVFIGCISLQVSFSGNALPLGLLDIVASLLGWSALWLEYTSDNQLSDFKSKPDNAGKVLDTGVWSWCRHPNYLGEIGFWLALFVYAWGATGNAAFDVGFDPFIGPIWGPVAMLALFVGISIPMIDKRLADRQGFQQHMNNTFALLPVSHLIYRQIERPEE